MYYIFFFFYFNFMTKFDFPKYFINIYRLGSRFMILFSISTHTHTLALIAIHAILSQSKYPHGLILAFCRMNRIANERRFKTEFLLDAIITGAPLKASLRFHRRARH